MKVRFKTQLTEEECRKRVDEDANALRQDAKLMCDMEEGKKDGYSLRQRIGWIGLKRALQAQMLAAKIGGSIMDWANVVSLMKSFSDVPAFNLVSYIDGIGIIEYVDDYVQYVGFARMKYDDKGAKESVLKTLKKVMSADEVSIVEDIKSSPLIEGGNENDVKA